MGQAIGIRLPDDVLKLIEKVSKEELEDRSTIIRKLIMIGYKDFMKKKAAEDYLCGKITISEAANDAGITIWEMEQYLVSRGFKSSYSAEDLKAEIKLLY